MVWEPTVDVSEITTVATDSLEEVALKEVSPKSGLVEVIVAVTIAVEFVKILSMLLISITPWAETKWITKQKIVNKDFFILNLYDIIVAS